MSAWIEYQRMDDEIQEIRLARAITMAFKVERKPKASGIEEEEEVIDTTDPSFAKNFKGFINEPKGGRPPQRGFAGNKSTEILMG